MLGSARLRRGLVAAAVLAVAALVPSPSGAGAVDGRYVFPTGGSKANASIGAYAEGPLDMVNSYISLDSVRLPSSWTANTLYANAKNMAEGPHAAGAHIVDKAGKVADVAWSFYVDQTPPTLGAYTPQGVTPDLTPFIGVAVSDQSGIDMAKTVMTISLANASNTVFSQLTPTYDAAAGQLKYQVPDVPTSADLGHGPLPPGDYLLSVTAYDKVGNRNGLSWIFTVDPAGISGA
jgi:hypothetical protein